MNRRHQRVRDAGWAALFLAPSLAVFSVFVIYPLVRTFYMSTRRIGLFGRGSKSVGLQQLLDVATSASFRNSMWRSLLLVALTVPTGIALGVALAVLANTRCMASASSARCSPRPWPRRWPWCRSWPSRSSTPRRGGCAWCSTSWASSPRARSSTC